VEDLRTCRICRKQDHHLFRYGARQYAHAKCFLKRHGWQGLAPLDHDSLTMFPAVIAAEHGLLGKLLELVRESR
jgi:hypothetical protein